MAVIVRAAISLFETSNGFIEGGVIEDSCSRALRTAQALEITVASPQSLLLRQIANSLFSVMRLQILILMILIRTEAGGNGSRMRNLLSRIENLMSRHRRRADGVRKLNPPVNGKCGLGEEVRFCRPTCEPSCLQLVAVCSATCGAPVCMCKRGSVRQFGMCIPSSVCRFFDLDTEAEEEEEIQPIPPEPTEAPIISTAAPISKKSKTTTTAALLRPLRPPPQCGQGQQFTRCVCDSTCQSSKVCKTCSSGCGCFLHHVRVFEGADICIQARKCPQQDMKKPLKTTSTSRVPPLPFFSRRVKQSRSLSASLEAKPKTKDTLVRSKTVRKLARASKTVKGTLSTVQGSKEVPLPKQSFVDSKPASLTEKSTETIETLMIPAHMGEHGPKPPPRHLHEAAVSKGSFSGKRGPPSARPLHYGPPSFSPSDFFRMRRQKRKGRKVRRLRVRHMVKH